jgi:hypothetical protein
MQRIVNEVTAPALARDGTYGRLRDLHLALTTTTLRSVPLWLLGTSDDELAIALRGTGSDGSSSERLPWLAAAAFADRDYALAADRYGELARRAPRDRAAAYRHVHALALAGRRAEAAAAASAARARAAGDADDRAFARFLRDTFGI